MVCSYLVLGHRTNSRSISQASSNYIFCDSKGKIVIPVVLKDNFSPITSSDCVTLCNSHPGQDLEVGYAGAVD